MSLASIEARAAALMSMHKEELTRAIAHFEFATGRLFNEAEAEVRRLLGLDEAPEPVRALTQGTDPVIEDVPPAPTEPETLDLDTLETIPCAGVNCGTTTGEHSTECVAEHAAAVAGNAAVEGADAPKDDAQ